MKNLITIFALFTLSIGCSEHPIQYNINNTDLIVYFYDLNKNYTQEIFLFEHWRKGGVLKVDSSTKTADWKSTTYGDLIDVDDSGKILLYGDTRPSGKRDFPELWDYDKCERIPWIKPPDINLDNQIIDKYHGKLSQDGKNCFLIWDSTTSFTIRNVLVPSGKLVSEYKTQGHFIDIDYLGKKEILLKYDNVNNKYIIIIDPFFKNVEISIYDLPKSYNVSLKASQNYYYILYKSKDKYFLKILSLVTNDSKTINIPSYDNAILGKSGEYIFYTATSRSKLDTNFYYYNYENQKNIRIFSISGDASNFFVISQGARDKE